MVALGTTQATIVRIFTTGIRHTTEDIILTLGTRGGTPISSLAGLADSATTGEITGITAGDWGTITVALTTAGDRSGLTTTTRRIMAGTVTVIRRSSWLKTDTTTVKITAVAIREAVT